MKAVYKNERERWIWLIVRWVAILVVYVAIAISYVFVNVLIHDNIANEITFYKIIKEWWYIIFVFVAPLIFSGLHFSHIEKGWLLSKLVLWLFIGIFGLLIPVVIIGFGI